MDLGSPDKRVEDCKEEDEASVNEKLDLNMFDSKDETVNEAMNSKLQVYSNQEHSVLPVAVDDEELQSSIIKSNSPSPLPRSKISEETCLPIELDLNSDDVNKRTSCHNNEGLRPPLDACYTHNEKEGTYYVGLSNELLDSSSDGTFNNKVETEHLDPSINYPLPEIGDKQARDVDDDTFDNESAKFLSSNAPVNGDSGNISGNSYSEKVEFVREEMDGRNSSNHTEMNEDCYPTRMVPSDYGRIEGENYSPHSHRDRNATPSPERQRLSVSPERSPRTQHSARQEERPSPANSDREKAPSPSISKRKRSPSPEKRSVGRKRASSRDGLSSDRRRSPSDRTAQRDSHHKDDSPRKRSTASPRRRESPRRRNRSLSRSPVRRGSSSHRREHRGRSRSRSPYSRDRYRRSSRRRHSPRHRSPPSGYHSRRRSPRRPWSPPANRNTGVGRPGNNLFVAGFSYVTTERDLEKKFSRFGRVTDVRIVRDKRTGDSRGFGFLSLERDEDADAAIRAVDQTEWNGRIVLVEKSKTSLR